MEINNETNFKELVCDGNNLLEAFKSSQKGSNWKPQTQKFEYNLLENLAELQKDILEDKYVPAEKSSFILKERGKTRFIHCSNIRDRVFQHSFCDNVLMPLLKNKLIYDNYASQKDKGISMGRERLKTHLRKFFQKNHSNEGYILLIDFSAFYDNIRHDLLIKELQKYVKDEWTLKMIRLFLWDFKQDVSFLSDKDIEKLYYGKYKALDYANISKEFKTKEKFIQKSINIGDQCSQIFGIFFPYRIDNYIKIVRSQKFYGRYVDDSYIINKDKSVLIDLLKNIKRIATELGIILNDRKIKIIKISKTFRFLQNKYFLTSTGKVVERVNPKRVAAERHRLNGQFNKKVPLQEIIDSFKSWKGTYFPIMSKLQKKSVKRIFNKGIERY